jgi:hypothetical protein
MLIAESGGEQYVRPLPADASSQKKSASQYVSAFRFMSV